MGEFLKRELAINTAFSRLFWDEKPLGSITFTTPGVAQNMSGIYRYSGAGIFVPQNMYLIAIDSSLQLPVGVFGTRSYSFSIYTINGTLLKVPCLYSDQHVAQNQSYDNFDHVDPLTENEGYRIDIIQTNAQTLNVPTNFRFGISGIEYLD
ncbi:MAG: hypothetical protein V4563_17225 [Pseudomonadota bacterium]